MDAQSPGFWLMVSYERPHSLQRFFDAAARTGMTTPGYVVLDEADYVANNEAYDALSMPSNWSIHTVPGGNLTAATERAWSDLIRDDTRWIGCLYDDLIPETPGWDALCIQALNGWNFVSTDDAMHAPVKANGATVWSADLIRAVGYLSCPDTKHFYVDTMWEHLSTLAPIWSCLMHILVRHAHHTVTGKIDDTVKRTERFWAEDDAAFYRWRDTEMLPAAERVLALMESYGVEMMRPDLKGMKVMIATPCGDGKYDRQYLNSLRQTERALEQFGAVVHWLELPFCSDVALARNKIVGQFYRGDSTHLMWVDDDMGWSPNDIVTLLMSGHDFCAVAGPRKTVPMSFAVDCSTPDGQPMPIREDARTKFLEVTAVGGAFVCMTRSCVERLIQAHPELMFYGAEGRKEYGIYTPYVDSAHRYRSEDFAVSDRWVALGGKVYVAAGLSLKHAGGFVFEGAWGTHLLAKMQQEQAA